jgi:hypothetical protein
MTWSSKARGLWPILFSVFLTACTAKLEAAQHPVPPHTPPDVGLERQARPASQAEFQAEFEAAVQAATPAARSTANDPETFWRMVQPFGPLDLIVFRATTAGQASYVRSFFVGLMGRTASIELDTFKDAFDAWHCGAPCAMARRDTLTAHLRPIRSLVERFEAMRGLQVLAPWPQNGYRAGLLTFDGQCWGLDTASPLMGFIPWQRTILADSGRTYLAAMGVDRPTVELVIGEMRRAHLAVLAREPFGGIRAVLHGAIGDNEAGLLFLPADVTPPSFEGAELMDGRKYVFGEPVAPGVYFYVTT